MAFGVEATIPAEVDLRSHQVENYDKENNAEQMIAEPDLVKEKQSMPSFGPLLATNWWPISTTKSSVQGLSKWETWSSRRSLFKNLGWAPLAPNGTDRSGSLMSCDQGHIS